MKRMNKLIIFLSLAFFAVVPSCAQSTAGDTRITQAGVYTLRGKIGAVVVDAPKDARVELVLSGAEISGGKNAAIYCKGAKSLVITLADGTKNVVTDAKSYAYDNREKEEPDAAIFSASDITVQGTGSLTVNANHRHGILSKDDLKIKGGTLSVHAKSDALRGKDSVTVSGGTVLLEAGKDGISSTNATDEKKGWVRLEGGSVTIHANGDAVQAESSLFVTGGLFDITTDGKSAGKSKSQKGLKAGADITIENGTFRFSTADDAINAGRDTTIRGGDFSIRSGDDGIHADRTLTIDDGSFTISECYEGLEGTQVHINGGKIFINARNDAIGAAAGTDEAKAFTGRGANPLVAVHITGGEIEAVGGGDTVDSNGDIFVSGGTLRLSSPAEPFYEGALLCNGTVTVSGGSLALVGNIGVELVAKNQPVLIVSHPNTQKSGAKIELKAKNGATLLETTARKDFKQTIFSSPTFRIGETYALYINGKKISDLKLTSTLTKTATDGGTFTGGYPRGHW